VENMLTLARQIRGLSSAESQGILAIEFRSSDLSALWEGVDLGENGYFFITDANGEIIYHSQKKRVGTVVTDIFQHAFPDGVEDYHFVRIDAGESEGIFWISVEDNGSGIPEPTLIELQEKLNANRLVDGEVNEEGKKDGIGVLNVHRRIQMVFGEEYGLRIESKVDQGTKMIMVMPAYGHSN
jgi:signal transduction histidine kinase